MPQVRVDLKTDDGVLDLHLFEPEGVGPWPAVILYMDAFGIRQALFDMAVRLSSHGYLIALPNLYYRSGAYAPFDPHAVAIGGPERDRFKAMIASLDNSLVMRDTAVVLAYLDAARGVRAGSHGVVGYCMGGGFALAAAGTFPDRISVAASFHGGSLATPKPDSAHLLAGSMRARVYVGAAGIDPSFSEDQRTLLEGTLRAAGVDYTLEVYEGAKHGFAVNGHLVYDRAASERHWATLVRLLNDSL